MRRLLRLMIVGAVLAAGWLPPQLAQADSLDNTADRVVGQGDFGSGGTNGLGFGPKSLDNASGAVLDSQGNLYVADANNNRVLEFNAPLTTGAAANRVFGQPNVTSNFANHGGAVSASGLYVPFSMAADAQGRLYVADYGNSRVLEYNAPVVTHAIADRVFGQPDFGTNTANAGGLSATSLFDPESVALDAHGNVFVADYRNSRVVEYDRPMPLLRRWLPVGLR